VKRPKTTLGLPPVIALFRFLILKTHPNSYGEGPIRRTREGGSEWEPIKILLEGDGNSNKMNTASNTRL
jgi:hypothetical protein